MSATIPKEFLCPVEQPVNALEASKAFKSLSTSDQLYAMSISRACWAGAKIVFRQVSEESEGISDFILTMFRVDGIEKLKDQSLASGVTEEDYSAFMNYCAAFFGNMGNYKSFGDTKFIPRIPSDSLKKIASASTAEDVIGKIYSIEDHEKQLGMAPEGITTYINGGVTEEEAKKAEDVLASLTDNDHIFNTTLDKDGSKVVIQVASAETTGAAEFPQGVHNDVEVRYGKFSDCLDNVARFLQFSQADAANDYQKDMMENYVEHFKTGAISKHKDAQRHWVKDKGPNVECNIGFIECYRDPRNLRGEFEGFVAVVDKEESTKFSNLVELGKTKLISELPWGPEFEKDTFLEPDFTSLDVVTFTSSGVPAGINIPNYDDIRQEEGFKNVALGNVLSSYKKGEEFTFVTAEDSKILDDWSNKAFTIQVGVHEALGHGVGKLFMEDSDGKLNFKKTVIDPTTNKPVQSWYKPDTNFNTVYGSLSNPYEECRAECVGITLGARDDVLEIFGYEGSDADNIVYSNWLSMARAGVMSLAYYEPTTAQWGQAHMRARHAILNTMLRAGEGFVTLKKEKSDTLLTMDGSKIKTVGVPAINALLSKLNIFKAIGDKRGIEMFSELTNVTPEMQELRLEVLEKMKPRRVLVQPHVVPDGDGARLIEYPATAEGMVMSAMANIH